MVNTSPFYESGEITGTICLACDVTEWKKTEEALRESENRNRAMLEAMPDMMFSISRDGIFLDFNPSKELTPVVDPEEFIGKSIYDIFPDLAQQTIDYVELTLQTGVTQVFKYELQEMGQKKQFEARISPLGDNDCLIIVRDITQFELAEKIIKDSKQFLDTILNSINEAISIIDVNDFTIIEVNEVFLNETGFTKEEVIGKTCYAITHNRNEPCVPPEHVCPLYETLNKRTHSIVEHIHYTKDGEKNYVEVSTSPMTNQAGEIIQVVHTSKNINQRKQAEFELKEVNDKLKETYIQLLQTGKLAAMGEMSAGVAHELTQPLLGIQGFATAMLEDMKGHIECGSISMENIQECARQNVSDLEIILQQTERMSGLINNIRSFARESQDEMKPLDVNIPISDALMLFSEQLRVHNIKVETYLTPELPMMMGNSNQLQQVMINLITNARDAMNGKKDKGKLIITTLSDESGVSIEVEDNGIGINEKNIDKIFEPFFTTKKTGESTGLGLSIVRKIIEDHKGTIRVNSNPGQGCKFTIHLPATKIT